MYKPISLAIITGLIAVIVILFCPLPETGMDGELTELRPQFQEEWDRDQRLEALSARTLAGMHEREVLITGLLEVQVPLDRVRNEFARLNDQTPASWVSLRAAFPGRSDAQCVDLQIRNYVHARLHTPEQRAAHAHLVAELEREE